MAVHRFGTNRSGIVDNASSGGIFANIDIKTGILEEAYSYYSKDFYEKHPDTGIQIKGVKIPNWNMIKENLLKIATKFPYINFVAWDIVPTKEGFSVIEGNTSTGFGLLQGKHGIAKSELAEFYKKFGI